MFHFIFQFIPKKYLSIFVEPTRKFPSLYISSILFSSSVKNMISNYHWVPSSLPRLYQNHHLGHQSRRTWQATSAKVLPDPIPPCLLKSRTSKTGNEGRITIPWRLQQKGGRRWGRRRMISRPKAMLWAHQIEDRQGNFQDSVKQFFLVFLIWLFFLINSVLLSLLLHMINVAFKQEYCRQEGLEPYDKYYIWTRYTVPDFMVILFFIISISNVFCIW